jgi:hypothetical protein
MPGNKQATTAYPENSLENQIIERFQKMSNETSKKESMTRVEEFRERLTREDLERRWQLEALDHLFTESENHPERFHSLWVKPLITAGLSLESALNLVVEAYFRPN